MRARQIAVAALLLALALTLSYAERLIPPIVPSVPGIKPGLANIVTLIILYGRRVERPGLTAAIVAILRVLLAGLLFTGASAMLYSLAGAAFSLAVMLILKKLPFSIIGVSVAGGVAHNLAQLYVAAAVLGDRRLMLYYPVLILAGIAAGALTGVVAFFVTERLKNADN